MSYSQAVKNCTVFLAGIRNIYDRETGQVIETLLMLEGRDGYFIYLNECSGVFLEFGILIRGGLNFKIVLGKKW